MKTKGILILLFSFLFAFMTACSSNDSNEGVESYDSSSSNDIADSTEKSEQLNNEMGDESVTEEKATEEAEDIATNRMIIHQAQMRVNVENLEKAQLNIEKKVNKYGGYIVESYVYREKEEQDELVSGNMTVRIPEEHFQTFLTDTEEEAVKVLERNVTGKDVTEEYVDLESRLHSKQTVEERLLEFMGDAEKTEDLLKISSDLSNVQEEIEVIVGKMKYLENQTSYSTIDISMFETSVNIPGIDGTDLNTWEKTKKQLATSINFLLSAGSGFIVFFIGNIPVIVIVTLVGLGVYLMIRKKRLSGK